MIAEGGDWMITEDLIEEVGYEVMKRAVSCIPADMFDAVKDQYEKEGSLDAKRIYENFFDFVERRTKLGGNICPDTGTIMYYIAVGNKAVLEPDLDFWRPLARATVRLTKEGILSPKSGDPIRHINNNLNVGENSPSLQYKLIPGVDFVELSAVAKGGGGEMSGSKFRMLTAADHLPGIKKFIIDGAISSAKGGLNCPPAIYGVGIGGGLGIAGTLAHEAAVLRPVGSRNPDRYIAAMEEELLEVINYSGIGPAGLGGGCTALDVHVEFSNGHMDVVAVALVSQCLMAHRATAQVGSDSVVKQLTYPTAWFVRPWKNYYQEVAK
jgi:tartrate/fumarate subfamily iron-sulfur-dependent hydro-lyase alpha chain